MYVDLISTPDKNTFQVTDSNHDSTYVKSSGDITATSKILDKENDIEALVIQKSAYNLILDDLIDNKKFIKNLNRIIKIFMLIAPFLLFSFGFSHLILIIMASLASTLFLSKIATSCTLGTLHKVDKKIKFYEEKIDEAHSLIEACEKELDKLKEQLDYHVLEDTPTFSFAFEQGEENIYVRRLANPFRNMH